MNTTGKMFSGSLGDGRGSPGPQSTNHPPVIPPPTGEPTILSRSTAIPPKVSPLESLVECERRLHAEIQKALAQFTRDTGGIYVNAMSWEIIQVHDNMGVTVESQYHVTRVFLERRR